MDETWTLIFLSLAMLVGCYLAGSIPLAVTFSEEKLKLVSVLGAGLLVGTALAVIIPEGVHTLYMTEEGHHHEPHEQEHLSRKLKDTVDEVVAQVAETDHAGHDHHGADLTDHQHHTELHTWIGVALVLGFIFMLIVDQLGGAAGHSHTADAEAGSLQNRNKITATLGLVVHAAADGVALGAAASTSQTHVEMIVFIAIMLHKAPAAFGLVSFLLHEGLDRNRIRRHLAAFSVAAPLLSVITYFGLSQQSKETLSNVNATAMAMLFSGGTFLYVATVHILPELACMGSTRTTLPDGTVLLRQQKGFTKVELLLMVVGAILPLFLSLGHHH